MFRLSLLVSYIDTTSIHFHKSAEITDLDLGTVNGEISTYLTSVVCIAKLVSYRRKTVQQHCVLFNMKTFIHHFAWCVHDSNMWRLMYYFTTTAWFWNLFHQLLLVKRLVRTIWKETNILLIAFDRNFATVLQKQNTKNPSVKQGGLNKLQILMAVICFRRNFLLWLNNLPYSLSFISRYGFIELKMVL